MPNDNDIKKFASLDREALQGEAKRLATELAECNRAFTDLAKASRADSENSLELAEAIIAQSPSVLFRRLADHPTRLVYVSRNISQWGYKAEDFLSGARLWRDVVHPDDLEALRREVYACVENSVVEYSQEYRILTADGNTRWVLDHTSLLCTPEGDKLYNQGIVTDITERKIYERELRRKERKFRRILETTAQGFLLLDTELRITDVNDACCALVGMTRDELVGRLPYDMASPQFREYFKANKDRMLASDKRVFESELMRPDGTPVPVLVHGNALTNSQDEIVGHMAFVTDLTEQKRALKLAGEVQRRLLDVRPPNVPGLEAAGRSEPCDEVGGDYLDFPPLHPESKGMMAVVGDISGHGVDAALCMTAARALFRASAVAGLRPAPILTALNKQFTVDHYESGRFMTLFVLQIEADGSLSWCRAGHDPAVVYDPDKDVFTELEGKGVPVGVYPDFTFEENRLKGSGNGRIVALGSDGIWEAVAPSGEMFGKDRFKRVIRENAHRPAGVIVKAVFDAVHEFTAGDRRRDDVTLLVIKQKKAG